MPETGIASGHLLVSTGVYITLLLVLGLLGRKAKQDTSLADHFLASRSIGFFVLVLTLFATQYSGNSLVGFPGKAYRDGAVYFMSVTFMVAIVTGYVLFAPRLFQLSRAHNFVTPNDYLNTRFGSRALHIIATVIFLFVLVNFLLAQMKALGNAYPGITGGRITYEQAVIGGAFVILVYELLGGMRAVAWTDALQGSILVVGLLFLAVLLIRETGTPAEVFANIAAVAPQKIANPSAQACRTWLSSFLLLGLGAPLYPQAIQRIYAARGAQELRRALSVMALLPLVAITTVIFIGVSGITLFPNLDKEASDGITFRVLGHLVEHQPYAYLPTLLVMMAVVAAIMSTADSCLLSVASIVTKDVIGRAKGGQTMMRRPWVVPVTSLVTMLVLVQLALSLKEVTLWALLEVKFEVLIQLSPAFLLGTLHAADDPRAFNAQDILTGLCVGLAVALGVFFTQGRLWEGMHAGVLGVVANYAAVLATRWYRLRFT